MLPFLKQAVANVFSKPHTEAFPAAPAPAKANYRGRISYDAEKCANCGNCMKVCSPAAITRIEEEVEGGTRITYEFDLTSCTFCGTCQDFCDEGAIKMTDDYHMVATDPEDLIVRGTRIKKAISGDLTCDAELCVYCTMCAKKCPNDALVVDRKEKIWQVDLEKCVKCGICVGKCPKKALSFQ